MWREESSDLMVLCAGCHGVVHGKEDLDETVFEAASQSLVIGQLVTLKSPATSGVVFCAKPTGI